MPGATPTPVLAVFGLLIAATSPCAWTFEIESSVQLTAEQEEIIQCLTPAHK